MQDPASWMLLGKIAEGSATEMWVVQRGRERCALKLSTPSHQGEADRQALLRHEAAVMQHLAHPHIVRLLETGEGEWGVYECFELVDGPSLAATLRLFPRAVPAAAVVAIAAAVADALAAVHAAGFVHGDVAARNVLLSRTGDVKLTDFGSAAAGGDTAVDMRALAKLCTDLAARADKVHAAHEVLRVALPEQDPHASDAAVHLRAWLHRHAVDARAAVADVVVALGLPSLLTP